jgi:hypothetical protein
LATAASPLEKAKKPKAAVAEPTLSSPPPPVSALETANNSKPNAAESAPSLLSLPPHAKKTQLTSPLAAAESSKDTAVALAKYNDGLTDQK